MELEGTSKPRARKRAAIVLLLVLGSCALASLAGGGLLLAERRGYVTLRRVPEMRFYATWEDARGSTIAIVNTEVTGGALLLKGHQRGTQRFWVPARSILLRDRPDDIYELHYAATGERLPDATCCFDDPPRFVARGTCVSLEWCKGVPPQGTHIFVFKEPGVSLVADPALRVTNEAAVINGNEAWEFVWGGEGRVTVEIEAMTTDPGFFLLCAFGLNASGSDMLRTEPVIVRDADMSLVDDRFVPRAR